MSTPNQDALPGSTVLPVESKADPAAAVARFLGLKKEDISVVSMEEFSKEEVKIRYYVLP